MFYRLKTPSHSSLDEYHVYVPYLLQQNASTYTYIMWKPLHVGQRVTLLWVTL